MGDLRRWLRANGVRALLHRQGGVWIATLFKGRVLDADYIRLDRVATSPSAALRDAVKRWPE